MIIKNVWKAFIGSYGPVDYECRIALNFLDRSFCYRGHNFRIPWDHASCVFSYTYFVKKMSKDVMKTNGQFG